VAQVKLTPLELNYITELINDTGGGKFVSDIMEEVPSLKIKDGILSFADKHKDKFNKFIDDLWIAEKAPSGPGAHTIPPRIRSGNIITKALKYNPEIGAIVNTTTDDVASQAELKTWADDNPMPVKAGTSVKPGLLRKTGRALAHVGLPLPTAALDTYFIGRQIEEGRDATEIAKDPFNWLGLATMSPLTKAAGYADKSGKLASVMRLGMSPGMIRGATRFLGLPGLIISGGLTAYDQYQKYKNKEGFIYDLFNREEIDNAQV